MSVSHKLRTLVAGIATDPAVLSFCRPALDYAACARSATKAERLCSLLMPLFHLHLWQEGACIVDEAGAELPDERSAIATAKTSLGEMLADDLRAQRKLANRCIVVTDEDGTTVAQVTMEKALQPLQSAPAACPT